MRFQVLVDDNYHYMDESERYGAGEFETWDQAVAKCQSIVDRSLEECYESGMSAEELWKRYTMFGEDPFIVGTGDAPRFSAWSYARERCTVICAERRG